MRLLVVEDEPKLASLLQRALSGQGHDVHVVGRGDVALSRARDESFDALVLDVMLPGLSGIEVCRRLREHDTQTAVVMLTARGAVGDRIAGLESGADDYLVKPFSLRELYARLDAVQRRSRRTDAAQGDRIVAGDLTLDVRALTATREGVTIELRPKECAVLASLVRRCGNVVDRYDILEEAWGGELDQRSNILDAQIKRLREKVDRPFGRSSIETVRGIGYRFRSDR